MASGYPDYEGGKQRVYLTPEWAAKEGIDKTFTASGGPLNFGVVALLNYNVPVGKTLVLTDLSFTVVASVAANGELNQIGTAYVKNATTGVVYISQGGNGGGVYALRKPVVILGGEQLEIGVASWTNHPCHVRTDASGYEV